MKLLENKVLICMIKARHTKEFEEEQDGCVFQSRERLFFEQQQGGEHCLGITGGYIKIKAQKEEWVSGQWTWRELGSLGRLSHWSTNCPSGNSEDRHSVMRVMFLGRNCIAGSASMYTLLTARIQQCTDRQKPRGSLHSLSVNSFKKCLLISLLHEGQYFRRRELHKQTTKVGWCLHIKGRARKRVSSLLFFLFCGRCSLGPSIKHWLEVAIIITPILFLILKGMLLLIFLNLGWWLL